MGIFPVNEGEHAHVHRPANLFLSEYKKSINDSLALDLPTIGQATT